MLSQASLPSSYWSFAAQNAVSLINILPTSVLHWVSPWTKLFSTTPDLTQLKVFGCACYPNLRPYNTHKLEPKTRECVFIGYPSYSKGYICLDQHTIVSTLLDMFILMRQNFHSPLLLILCLLPFFLLPAFLPGFPINSTCIPQINLPYLVLIPLLHLLPLHITLPH